MTDIQTEIGTIVTKVSQRFMAEVYPKLTADLQGNIKRVNYIWASWLEIIQILNDMQQHTELMYEKMPAIFLLTDIDEQIGQTDDYDGCVLEIVLCNATKPDYLTTERRIHNFIPILRPMYRLFLEELTNSTFFGVIDIRRDAKHNKKERYFWGKETLAGSDGNITNDHLDAIHLRNLRLTIQQTC